LGSQGCIAAGDTLSSSGPIAKLSDEHGYFTRRRLVQERGLGIEIVLEVDDVQADYRGVRASGHPIAEDLQERPWGLIDFRIVDPDGYYLRVTARDPAGRALRRRARFGSRQRSDRARRLLGNEDRTRPFFSQ